MSGYIGAIPVPQATQTRQSFTATAGQTTFATAGYTPQFLDVFMNGVHLLDGVDFTATNGSDVSLTSGAAAGDIIEVVAYSTYQVNDQAFTGNFSVDTDTLYVDSANNMVGVGTASALYPYTNRTVLNVNGASTSLISLSDAGSSSSNAYFYWDGSNLSTANNDASGFMNWVTGGVETLRLQANGNLGVGTAAPTSKIMANAPQSSGVADLLTLRDASAGTTFNFQTYSDPSYGTSNRFDFNGAYLAFRRSGTEAMRINANGQACYNTVGLNTAGVQNIAVDSSTWFNVGTAYRAGTVGNWAITFQNPSGQLVGYVAMGASSTTYSTTSDYRLKEDVQPMTGASERVLALNPVNFAWSATGERVDGFLAHEAQAVVPEAVTGEKDAVRDEEYEVKPAVLDDYGKVVSEAVMGTRSVPDYQGIDQSKLVPLLTAALQEALGRIETLEADVATLKGAS